MVGLSIVLEVQKQPSGVGVGVSKKTPQVISKTAMILSNPASSSGGVAVASSTPSSPCTSTSLLSSTPSTDFLDQCNLCRQKLLPGKDIYMYKGDRAFCSVECRCKQILMDEEESVRNENCSVAAMKPSASSSSSSSAARHHRRGTTKNRAGGFAY